MVVAESSPGVVIVVYQSPTLDTATQPMRMTRRELDSLLQEQLARLRSSWDHEIQQPGPTFTAAPATPNLQHLSDFGTNASELHFLFARLFTPKHPSTLPRSQWLSYTRLFSTVQPYAPARVWKHGRGNLKQLVIEWCQHHPAFAGLAQSVWCMRGDDNDQPHEAGRRQPTVYKFCLDSNGGDEVTSMARGLADAAPQKRRRRGTARQGGARHRKKKREADQGGMRAGPDSAPAQSGNPSSE